MRLATIMFFDDKSNQTNDGWLSFADMVVEKYPFPMNMMNLEGKKVLIQSEVAELAHKDNVVIGEFTNNKEATRSWTQKPH